MSKVDFQRKQKKEEEEKKVIEQKKVVGQQQKTQTTSHTPTGTTSIPKDTNKNDSRTRKGTASLSSTRPAQRTQQKSNSTDEDRRRYNMQRSQRITGYNSLPSVEEFKRSRMSPQERAAYDMQTLSNRPQPKPTRQTVSGRDFVGSKRSGLSDTERNDLENRIANVGEYRNDNKTLTQQQKELEDKILNADRYTEDNKKAWNEELLSPEEIEEGVKRMTPETLKKWTDGGVKLDKGAEQIAKEYAKRQLNEYDYRSGHVPVLDKENREKYADLVNLMNKTSPLASFSQSALQPFLNVANVARDAGVKAAEKLGLNTDSVEAYNKQIDESNRKALENARVQDPGLSVAGQFAGNAGLYAMTNPIFDSIGAAAGVTSKAGKFALNQAGQNLQDIALDTIPTFNQLSKDGSLSEEDKRELASDAFMNVLGNAVMGGVGEAFTKNVPEQRIVDNAIEQSNSALNDIENLTRQLPEIDATNPYADIDNILVQRNINNALGTENPLSRLKDEQIVNLTRRGGDQGTLANAYNNLVNAADMENIDDFTRALNDYRQIVSDNNIPGLNRPLTRLEDAVNGNILPEVGAENYGYIANNVDAIEDGLNRIRNLEGLSDLGTQHLNNAYELLNQYDDAVRRGGDAQGISQQLNRVLGNLDNQAKKLADYDGTFSAWRGANTARGDLFTNTGRIQNTQIPEVTAEEKSMLDEWNNNNNRYARPANQLTENSSKKVNTDVPKLESVPADRGPKERLVDTNDVKERGYARSTRNNPDIPDEVAADFVDNPEIYNVLHNKDTKAKAQAILDKGFDDAYADYKDLLNKKDPAAVPLGYDLAKQMIENGDSRGAADLIRDMSKSLTESGQFSQAAAITLMRNDPMTALRYAEKELDALNIEGAKKFKNWTDFKLTDDEIKAFNALDPGDKEGITKLFNQIGARLGKEYPTTAMEKLLEARRVGMLFNVRTNVRNFGANVPTLGMRWASDRLDAVGQNIAHIINPDFKVTQSLTGSGKQGRKLATEVFNSEKVQNLLKNTDGKYADSVKSALVKEKQMYKGTAVDRWIDKMTGGGLQKLNEKAFGKKGVQSIPETIRNATYKALELGDSPFVKENFIERLGSYIKAQGYKSIDEIPEEAIETAWESAMKATYKDQSWAYKMIRDIKNGIGQAGKPGKVVSESLIPFVQAPGNIAARMVDYSPIGGANGIKSIIKGAKSGSEKAVREGINQLAQGATGSLALGIGIALHNSGLITGGYSQDKDKKSHEKNNGFREYALHIGDHYYTIDWAQPAFQTIMTGVLLADAINKSDEYDSDLLNYFGVKGSTAGKVIGASKEAAKTTINAWFNASPLQSMQDLLGGTYEDSSDIASKLWSVAAENFAGSYVPASVNAVAKTMDTTQRQTYDPSSKTASFVNSQIAKIPGLSEKLPAKYNTWGEEIKTADTTGEAAFNRFLNPGEGTKENKKPIDTELDRLFDATGNNAVYPQVAPNKVDGESLTAKQVSDLQKRMGEKSLEAANKFMDSDVYKEMSDKQKAEGYNDLYTTIKWAAQLEMSDSDTYKKMQEGDEEALKSITGNGATMKKKYITEGIDAVIDDIAFGQKKAEIDTTGNGSVTQDELLNYINNGHQDEADKLWDKFKGNSNATLQKDENGVYTLVDSKGSVKYGTDSMSEEAKTINNLLGMKLETAEENFSKAQSFFTGITPEEYASTYKDMDADGNNKIKQEEMFDYFKTNKISEEEAKKYWQAYGAGWKTLPTLKDGEWKTKKTTSGEKASTTSSNKTSTTLADYKKARDITSKSEIPSADDLPTADSSDGLNWNLNNGYDLKNTKTYARAKEAGISDSDFVNAWWAADSDGNGYMKKAEAQAYVNALQGLSKEERNKWFNVLYKGK